MAILEVGILVDSNVILEKKYYESGHAINGDLRAGLLTAVHGFAKEAFNTEFESFSLSSFAVVAVSRQITLPGNESEKHVIMMFAIIEKDTNEKVVKDCLNEALTQFLNRYSVHDILTKDPSHFKKFVKRFPKIFRDLTLKSEDRFGSMF